MRIDQHKRKGESDEPAEQSGPGESSPQHGAGKTPTPQTERRLQQLMREVDAAVAPPRQRSAWRGALLPAGRWPVEAVLGIGLALLVGRLSGSRDRRDP